MRVKKSVVGLLNPVKLAQEKYLIYQLGSAQMVLAVTGGGVFSNTNNLWTLSEERRDGKKDQDAAQESKLKGLVKDLKGNDKRLLIHAKSTGA